MTNGSRPHGPKGKKASGQGAGKGKKRTAADLAKVTLAGKVKAPATRPRG